MLEVTLRSLIKGDDSSVFQRVSEVIKRDFPKLSNIYSEILVIVADKDAIASGSDQKVLQDFLETKEIVFLGNCFNSRACSIPPKACIEINNATFKKLEEWQKDFNIRHECMHLLLRVWQPSPQRNLLTKYGIDYVKNFVRFQHEYVVHLNMIKRWPQDWLRDPVGYIDNLPDPSIECRDVRKTEGKKAAMHFEVQNMVHLLSLLEVYKNVPNESKHIVEKIKSTAERYLKSFNGELLADSKRFPDYNLWFISEDFKSESKFFLKVKKLLTIIDKESKGSLRARKSTRKQENEMIGRR